MILFSKTYRCESSWAVADIKSRLLGKHVKIHNLDFEVYEKDGIVKIIPHAEEGENIRTLPITHVQFKGNGNKTKVIIKSKMRRIDSGFPTLVFIFGLFLLIGAVSLFSFGEASYSYLTAAIGIVILGLLWFRLESGYFDYIRKIRDYVKQQSVQ
jgi:hypothetical protein